MNQTAYPSIPQPAAAGGSLPTGPEPQPIPYRQTPPWGENPIYTEAEPEAAPPAPPIDHDREDRNLHAWQSLAHGNGAFALDWENDHQYGYPPPGAPNVQPWDGGHFSVTPWDPSREQGWGMDPAFRWARYPHMENHFSRYNQAGQYRRNGSYPVYKPLFGTILTDRWLHTQQRRDLLAALRRAPGPHEVVTQDVPTVPHTMNVQQAGAYYVPAPIGIEGVLPDGALA